MRALTKFLRAVLSLAIGRCKRDSAKETLGSYSVVC